VHFREILSGYFLFSRFDWSIFVTQLVARHMKQIINFKNSSPLVPSRDDKLDTLEYLTRFARIDPCTDVQHFLLKQVVKWFSLLSSPNHPGSPIMPDEGGFIFIQIKQKDLPSPKGLKGPKGLTLLPSLYHLCLVLRDTTPSISLFNIQ
jgi:hypothetical protein